MIIGSDTKLEIGKVYNNGSNGKALSDLNGMYHNNIPFLVLRIATKQEYIDYIKQVSGILEGPLNQDSCYYEVSMD